MGALDNIRVVDFGHYVAGPVLGMLLADQGADVIKVDPPTGPPLVTEANTTWNRGKRSIALDLKRDGDRDIALQLIRRADVVVENFRPGVMDRLGLGETELRPHNPRVIYCSMPGFATDDPRSDLPAWEGTVLAAGDALRPPVPYRDMVQQLHRRPNEREGHPSFSAEPVASIFAALISSTAVAAALTIRDRTGWGQRVEVPLFDALIQSAGIHAMARLPFRAAIGPADTPWDHQYRCADDRWIHLACSDPANAEQLARILDRDDLISAGLTERRLADNAAHHKLILILRDIFRRQSAEHWEELLVANDLPGAVCRSGAEWLEHPQALESRALIAIEDPILGPTTQPAPLVTLSAAGQPIPNPAPLLGHDEQPILDELAADPSLPDHEEGVPLSPVVGPLKGVRVLDLAETVSGSVCGRVLAEFGADVIKIDSPERGTVAHHYDVNRGKRTMILDLENDEGYDLYYDLVETADVVIESSRPGVAEDLGIDWQLAAKENPELIYVSLSAHGERGPLAGQPAHTGSIQALTGMQVRYGGPEQPSLWPYPEVDDYAAGHAAAFGATLAVLHRSLTGKGQQVTADHLRTAGLLQSAFLLDHPTKTWNEPVGPSLEGSGPDQRLYACDDGWIFVGVRSLSQFEPVLGPVNDLEECDVERRVAAWCLGRSAAEAAAQLAKHDVGAHQLAWLNEIMSDPSVVRRGLSVVREHSSHTLLRTTGPGRWLSQSMVHTGRAAPPPGSDVQSILSEIGRAGDLEGLVSNGIVVLPPTSQS